MANRAKNAFSRGTFLVSEIFERKQILEPIFDTKLKLIKIFSINRFLFTNFII